MSASKEFDVSGQNTSGAAPVEEPGRAGPESRNLGNTATAVHGDSDTKEEATRSNSASDGMGTSAGVSTSTGTAQPATRTTTMPSDSLAPSSPIDRSMTPHSAETSDREHSGNKSEAAVRGSKGPSRQQSNEKTVNDSAAPVVDAVASSLATMCLEQPPPSGEGNDGLASPSSVDNVEQGAPGGVSGDDDRGVSCQTALATSDSASAQPGDVLVTGLSDQSQWMRTIAEQRRTGELSKDGYERRLLDRIAQLEAEGIEREKVVKKLELRLDSMEISLEEIKRQLSERRESEDLSRQMSLDKDEKIRVLEDKLKKQAERNTMLENTIQTLLLKVRNGSGWSDEAEDDSASSCRPEQVTELGDSPDGDGPRQREIIKLQDAVARHPGTSKKLLMECAMSLFKSGSHHTCMLVSNSAVVPCCHAHEDGNGGPSLFADDSMDPVCIPCSIGGVVSVPIIDCAVASCQIVQSIGLTEDRLRSQSNHLRLHLQLAKLFVQGLAIVVPEWCSNSSLAPSFQLRFFLLDEEQVTTTLQQNPGCRLSQSAPCNGSGNLSMILGNVHGQVVTVCGDGHAVDMDILALNIWCVFVNAVRDNRRLPQIDPDTGHLGTKFGQVTVELLEYVRAMCVELFNSAVADQQLCSNFVKAMHASNALRMLQDYANNGS